MQDPKSCYVRKCDIHIVAPGILEECLSLLKERSQLPDGLNNLMATILGSAHSEMSVNYGDMESTLSNELNNATWIRGVNHN